MQIKTKICNSVTEPPTYTATFEDAHSFEELNLSSDCGLVVFETSHLLLSPHSRGLGQQSGYWELESGNTAHEYVGLFTTLSQLKGKTL